MVVINAVLQGAGIVLAFSLGFNVPMIKFVLTAVTGLSLIWRRRWPLGIVIVNNVALMIKMIKSDSAEFLLPLLVAVYTLIAIASVRQRLLGIATTMVFMFIPLSRVDQRTTAGAHEGEGAAVGLHAGGRVSHCRRHRGVDHPITSGVPGARGRPARLPHG